MQQSELPTYTNIPNTVMECLYNGYLNKTAIKYYLYLRRYKNNESGIAWVGQDRTLEEMVISASDIAKARNNLIEAGLIETTEEDGIGIFVMFNETPTPTTKPIDKRVDNLHRKSVGVGTLNNSGGTYTDNQCTTITNDNNDIINTNITTYDEKQQLTSAKASVITNDFIDFEDLFDAVPLVSSSNTTNGGTPIISVGSKQQKMNELQKKWDLATDWETKKEIEAEFKQVYNLTF